MTLHNNPYLTLEIDNNSSQSDIKKAQLKLVKLQHPDSGESADSKKFNKISSAQEFLNSKENKEQLDDKLKKDSEISNFENNFESETQDFTNKDNYSKWKSRLKKASNKNEEDEIKDSQIRNNFKKFVGESNGNIFDRVNSQHRKSNQRSQFIKKDEIIKKNHKIEDLFSQRHIHEVTGKLQNEINLKNEVNNINFINKNESNYYSNLRKDNKIKNKDPNNRNELQTKDLFTGLVNFNKNEYQNGKFSSYNGLRLPMWERLKMSPERQRNKIKKIEQKKSENDQLKEEIRELSLSRGRKL